MNTAALNRLRVAVRPKATKFSLHYDKETQNVGARLKRICMLTTALFRHERIEIMEYSGTELQAYTELLLQEAIKYGPRHKPTMELFDFYMLEKDLIQKTFKVLVPRFEKYDPPYTKWTYIPLVVPGTNFLMKQRRIVLELKGNPYPPVEPRTLQKQNSLANILLTEAKREYGRQQQRLISEQSAPVDAKISPEA